MGKRVGRIKHWGRDSLVGGSGAEANTPRGRMNTGIYISSSTGGFQYLWPSSLSLIFHSGLRTPDGGRAQSICHEGSFQRGRSSGKPSHYAKKIVIFHTNVSPVKFLSLLFFHPPRAVRPFVGKHDGLLQPDQDGL